jgi:hypothetical protein
MRALGFEPVLYVYYEQDAYRDILHGTMVDKLVDFEDVYGDESVLDIVRGQGGIPVRRDGEKLPKGCRLPVEDRDFELVVWVTPLTTYNRQEGTFASHGNEPALSWAYGDICMVVRIGKANDRLAYPTAAQVKEAFGKKWNERFLRFQRSADTGTDLERRTSLRLRH